METIKHTLILGTALLFGMNSTQAGYLIKRNFVKGEVRTYKITYKVDSKSETSYETGFLTEKILKSDPEGETQIKYLYTLNELVQKGKKLEIKIPKNKDHITLDKNHQITNLYFGNTMLPYYVNILHEGILSDIPALNHSWLGYILDNNFQFEANPVLPESRNFALRYTLKDVIPFEDQTHNYRIDWQGIAGNLFFYSAHLYETPSRRKGSILLGSDSFPLEMNFQLPNKIPGYTLSEFILKDETPIILGIELIEKGTLKEDELEEETIVDQVSLKTIDEVNKVDLTPTLLEKDEKKSDSQNKTPVNQSTEEKSNVKKETVVTQDKQNINSKKKK